MPEDTYTLAQAAERIGVRQDTLTATLPDIGVDLVGRDPKTLTQAEVAKLSELIQRIKTLHGEGVE